MTAAEVRLWQAIADALKGTVKAMVEARVQGHGTVADRLNAVAATLEVCRRELAGVEENDDGPQRAA